MGDSPLPDIATAAINSIYMFNFRRLNAEMTKVPPQNRLYHYTTAEGLKGIAENHELWATAAYYLNDSAEVAYGCKVVSETLDEWLSKQKANETSLAVVLGKLLQAAFSMDSPEISKHRPVFLTCFCENENLLSQWRFYGQSGGYSVGFEVPTPKVGIPPTMLPEPVNYTSKWARVVYNRTEQMSRCREILEGTLPGLVDSKVGQAVFAQNPEGVPGVQMFLAVIAEMLLEEAVAFKDQAFEVENEWRIVVRPRETYKQADDDGGKSPAPIHFRTSNGLIVPYVKMLPTKNHHTKLPIVSVRTGPTLDKHNSALSVNMLMQKNGYSGVAVTGSGITLRL
jgi:hypothetical protein